MKQVIHAVFTCEKVLRVLARATGGFDTGVTQRLYITAGTKGFFPGAINEHRSDPVIVKPGFEAVGDDLHHLPGQRIQRLFNIEGELSNHPVSGRMLDNQHAIGHRFFHAGSRFSRNALVPSCWSSVEKRATNSSRSATRPSAIAIFRAE